MIFGQQADDTDLLLMLGGAGVVFAVDLDGSTEYTENTSPSNLDLNDANSITSLPRNSTFEDNATDWATNGTHVVTVDATSKLTSTHSGKIAASGIGDSTTNFASLADDKFTAIVSGNIYTMQMQVRADLSDTDIIIVIGGKAKTFSSVDQTSELLFFNFLATSAEVGQKIIVYLSQADDVFIDEVDLSRAYDLTVLVWFKANDVAGGQGGMVSYIEGSGGTDVGYDWVVRSGKLRINSTNSITFLSTVGVTDVDDTTWHLGAFILDRVNAETNIYLNGVSDASGGTPKAFTIPATRPSGSSTSLRVGTQGSNQEFNGLLGEIQIIRGQILTAAEILTAYNRGRGGKHFLPNSNAISWYRWGGGNNTIFLQDEQGTNNLTGVNVTQSGDQVKLKKYKD